MTPAEYQEHLRQDKIRIGHDPIGWAVLPASFFDFDPDSAVYCADIDTAYRVGQDQQRFGDQMIWKMTRGKPIKWVRVTVGEVVQTH
tara:strand:+ start:48 stop:308 length:261 start_codon:yes stop_codon:yes gene_type:complete